MASHKPITSNPPTGAHLKFVTVPKAPGRDVLAKQDPAHNEGEFLRDLGRATSNRAKEHLAGKDT
jgi:hypothetical protein